MQATRKALAAAITAALGGSAALLPNVASAAGLADGFYDINISNTPYIIYSGYSIGSDGAWNSSFTFGALPGISSNAMYDDTIAQPVNGNYAGSVNDGLQGTIPIKVESGVITGLGGFEFDTIVRTAGGNFAEYGSSTGFTGSIDAAGNISLTPTGLLGSVGDFPALVDEAWNIDNFNGVTGTGTTLVANPPNNNTAYDSFTTGSATNAVGTINGAAYDGNRAILVKAGSMGTDWGGFFGASYFEVWNIGFTFYGNCPPLTGGNATTSCTPPPPVPVPAAIWLFTSGLIGLGGITLRTKRAAG